MHKQAGGTLFDRSNAMEKTTQQKPGQSTRVSNRTDGEGPITLGDLELCFYNLANATETENVTLNKLVKSMPALTTANAVTMEKNSHQNKELH